MDAKMADHDKMLATRLPREVWSSIICQYIHTAGLEAALQLRCVNSTFDEEVMYALFILRVKNLRRSTKRLHIPHHIAFLQLQGFFAQKDLPRKQHKLARKGILRAAGHDPHRPISDTCFSYRPGQPCSRSLLGSTSSDPDCKAHDIINALICAQDSHVFVWGTDKEYRDDIFGVIDPRIWHTLVATYKNDHDRVRQILREMTAEEPVDDGVRFFNRCMLIATRTNNPSMILTIKTEVQGQSADNVYHRRRLGEASSLHNCLNEAIRLGYLEVFDGLLQWNWKFANTEWSLHRYLQWILEAKHFSQAQREDFFSTLLDRTDTWRDLSNMAALLMLIGESNDQRALEILLKVLKTKSVNRAGEGSYHIPGQPLLALTMSGNLEMVRLYLENLPIIFPTMAPESEGVMRTTVVEQELKSSSPRTALLKLIIDHSTELLREKLKLMRVLLETEVQKQKLETWAWLALKLDLKHIYSLSSPFGSSSLPKSFGSILLGDAVSALNVETVRFLVNNGVWLESEASTSQVYEDDEEMMGRLKSVQILLTRAGQGLFSERKTVETTFKCTIDAAPKPNKKISIPKKRSKRVSGLGIGRGMKDVVGTGGLEYRGDHLADKSVIRDDEEEGEVAPKVSLWPKTHGRSYAAVAATLAAKVNGGSSQKSLSLSSGSSSIASPISAGQSTADD